MGFVCGRAIWNETCAPRRTSRPERSETIPADPFAAFLHTPWLYTFRAPGTGPAYFPSGASMANNRIVHFEIPANHPQALTEFYGKMFGWTFQKFDAPGPEYWLCNTGSEGPGINGAIMQRQNAGQPWMNYVDVASVDDSLAAATRLGGQVALPKMPVGQMGFVAAIIDPQGNLCGLWELAKK